MNRVILYGFGYIGRMVAKEIVESGALEIIGAIDVDEKIVGKDVGEIIGIGKLGVKVSSEPEEVFEKAKPAIVIHATGSFLDKVFDQIVLAVEYGYHVVSTCETLAYPWLKYPNLADELSRRALERNVVVIGTGVNPGFIFDSLPAFLTSICSKVEKIKATRIIDPSRRRYSFQKKIGLGLTSDEFREKMAKGEITGHVGYAESLMLLSEMVGLDIANVIEDQEPIISHEYLETQYFKISPGKVKGIKGYGKGYGKDNKLKAEVEFIATVGVSDKDSIEIDCGKYVIKWSSNGVPGDYATVAMLLNVAKIVNNLKRGLRTMKDIVLLHA